MPGDRAVIPAINNLPPLAPVMKTIIIYRSLHRGNTEKVAKAMAEAAGARLEDARNVGPGDLAGYELIGFGSGIYQDRFHGDILRLIEEMPGAGKKVFIFSTAAVLKDYYHAPIREKLLEKGCTVVGEFTCPGEFIPLGLNLGRSLPGVLVLLSGKNQGRPDANDLNDARAFARKLVKD